MILTVSIVTFRTPFHVLADTLASLKRSTVAHEVVIVDNTPERDYFLQLESRTGLKCIHNPTNQGYGYGHNLAVKNLPQAAYHLVLNPDVILHEGCLETLVAAMDAAPDVGLMVPRVQYPGGELQHLNKRDPSVLDLMLRRFVPRALHKLPILRHRIDYYVTKDIGYEKPCDVLYASGCFMLFRRAVWDAVKGFDEGIFLHFEDADITRRVRAIARVCYCPDAVIDHLWARGSYNNLKLTIVTIASAIYYFRKWGLKWV